MKIQSPANILSDFIEGKSVRSIAEDNHVHPTTIYRTLHKFGVQNLKAPGYCMGRNELMASVYEGGMKIKDISAQYGLSQSGVYSAIRNYKNSCV